MYGNKKQRKREIGNGRKSMHCANSQIMKAESAISRESYARTSARVTCARTGAAKRSGRREEEKRKTKRKE